MPSICLYFQVHQPMRLNRFTVFNIGANHNRSSEYFNHKLNQEIFEKVAKKCYLPTNKILLNLINKYNGKFRVSFSLTGTFIEHCERYMPLYTIIYTAYCILLSSDKLRKGPVRSMNSNEQVKKSLAMQATSNWAIRSLFPEPDTK